MGQIIFFVIAGLGLVAVNWSTVKGFLPSFGGKSKADDVTAAFTALNTLVEYFRTVGCAEGEEAARACGPHLFHKREDVTA